MRPAREKDAIKFPRIILEKNLLGLTTPKNKPELKRDANVPLILPLISRKPGSNISIPGIKKTLSVNTARIVPAMRPPPIEIISE